MTKYNEDTVREIPNTEIVSELLIAQSNNIAKPNSDVSTISTEITRRLTEQKKK